MCADVLLCLLDPFWVKLSGQPRNNDAWGRNCRGVSGSNKSPGGHSRRWHRLDFRRQRCGFFVGILLDLKVIGVVEKNKLWMVGRAGAIVMVLHPSWIKQGRKGVLLQGEPFWLRMYKLTASSRHTVQPMKKNHVAVAMTFAFGSYVPWNWRWKAGFSSFYGGLEDGLNMSQMIFTWARSPRLKLGLFFWGILKLEKHDSVGISFPCWSLLCTGSCQSRKGRDPISAYVPGFKPCGLAFLPTAPWFNQSLHTLQEAKVTVDEIEAPEEAEADAMCLDINCCSLAGMQVACDQCIKLYD